MKLPLDSIDLLAAFAARGVEYLLVGGYAVAIHGRPRFTKDIDLWVGPDPANLKRARVALEEFGAPEAILDALEPASFEDVLWMGTPPERIDIVKGVPGGDFAQCYARRERVPVEGTEVSVVSRRDLITLKRACGRPQDLVDAEMLEES